MTNFEVMSDKVVLFEGILKLTQKQANARAHQLEVVDAKAGLFRLRGETHFKRGERFGFDGELSKRLVSELEDLDPKPDPDPNSKGKGKSKENKD